MLWIVGEKNKEICIFFNIGGDRVVLLGFLGSDRSDRREHS